MEAFVAASRDYLDICPEGLRKHTKELKLAGVPVKILTEHLPNRSPECYHYTNILGTYVKFLIQNASHTEICFTV
jgi:hypothetical protein